MIEGFSIIMAVLLAGDFFNKILKVPLPAPVIGLILLVLLLQSKIIKEKKIEKAAEFLLANMVIAFIPGMVKVKEIYPQIKTEVIGIVATCIISTFIINVVTAKVADTLIRRKK